MTIIYGEGTGPNGDRIDVWIEWELISQDKTNNKSRVIAYFYTALKDGCSSGTYGSNGCYSSFSVNGVSGTDLRDSGAFDFRVTTPMLMGSFDGWIPHNSDGTKTISMSGSFTTKSDWITGGNVSGNVTLTAIPRATTPIAPNFTMDNQAMIDFSSRASEAFTHTLKYEFAGVSGTIPFDDTAITVLWTPPLSLATAIPNFTMAPLKIICETYSGSTLIGTKNVYRTLYVPVGVVPAISELEVVKQSSNPAVAEWGEFVKGYSTVKLTATAAEAYDSPIQSYKFEVKKDGDVLFSRTQSSNVYTSGALTSAGSKYKFVVTVTDARGRTATFATPLEYTVYDYESPSISGVEAFRCDNVGTKDIAEGEYISAKGKFSSSFVNGNNVVTKKIEYRKNGTATWIEGQIEPADNTPYVIGNELISTDYSYEVRFSVTDSVVGAVVYTLVIKPGFVTLHVRPGGKGIGIGGAADDDELQVYMPAVFKDTLMVGDKNVLLEDVISLLSGKYYFANGEYGLDCKNSDIIGGNRFIFADVAGETEGLFFPKSGGGGSQLIDDYYNLRIQDGTLYAGDIELYEVDKVLWSGSWASGDITVPDFDKYRLFAVDMLGAATQILARKESTAFRGIGGFLTSIYVYSYLLGATFSGTTLTWGECKYVKRSISDDSVTYGDREIIKIYGII